MNDVILLTGGTGKTGRRLASLLQSRGTPYKIASRTKIANKNSALFDWTKTETWDGALEDVSATYLLPPTGLRDPAPSMIEFIKLA